MTIEFICEHCGKKLHVEEYLAGQQIECYHCHESVVIPEEDEVAIIGFQCLGCGTAFRVPASRAGSQAKCPKCEAVLTVPQPGGGTAPLVRPGAQEPPSRELEPIYSEELPTLPPRTPLVRALRAAGREPRTARDEPTGDDEEELVAPPKSRVSAGWIIFFAALALFLVIAIGVLVAKREPSGPGGTAVGPRRPISTQYVQIFARVKYSGSPLHIFEIVNGTPDVWRDVTLTIETSSGDYNVHRDVLAPNDRLTLEGRQFIGAGGTAFDPEKMQGKHLVITVRLPSGRMGRHIRKWLTTPSTPPRDTASP